ncbi:Transmembrane protein 42 [Madurella mycetomatis]|uniref:Transmembrane protein 42 n=1 Tax=Madurella mycetomatis TaxID=100816 RepID=A0A150ATF4_9PEZI|nr:Transmembrane protein 42 [Madurella mycetomatis]
MSRSDEEIPLLDGGDNATSDEGTASVSWALRNQWILFALASGACAAFNGVFAKLTTTELTASLSLAIARVVGLESIEGVVEFVVRSIFFGLNLTFNGVMWTLFTTALARGNSTTQVSIMNTSSNFVLTAILGLVIFSEALPPLWWVGAAMLIAGNVIVGQKDEGEPPKIDQDEPLTAGVATGSGAADVVASSSRVVGADGALGEGDVEKDEDVADLGLDIETEE